MNWFTKPKRVETGDVVLGIVVTLATCFFLPEHDVKSMDGTWLFCLVFLFPVSFIAGWLASNLDSASRIRAHWAMIAGAVAWPLCLIFRPIAANLALITFTFGAGPVAYHYFFYRNDKRR